jgi:hypothetical protein
MKYYILALVALLLITTASAYVIDVDSKVWSTNMTSCHVDQWVSSTKYTYDWDFSKCNETTKDSNNCRYDNFFTIDNQFNSSTQTFNITCPQVVFPTIPTCPSLNLTCPEIPACPAQTCPNCPSIPSYEQFFSENNAIKVKLDTIQILILAAAILGTAVLSFYLGKQSGGKKGGGQEPTVLARYLPPSIPTQQIPYGPGGFPRQR